MQKLLGTLGGAIPRPFLHAATLFLLISAASFLAMPDAANAQIWISSGFAATPGAQTETATCSTSAINPATGLPSPTATDYESFTAACSVTPSTGAVITSTNCPVGAWNRSYADTGNPTGQCSVTFQPQPGVTYTINSTHALWFYPSFLFAGSPDPNCPTAGSNAACWWDPEGYFTFSPKGHTSPTYSTTGASITQEVPCSATGPCTRQDIPQIYAPNPAGGWYDVAQVWVIAQSSAVYTPCPSPTIASITPNTWSAGDIYNIAIAGTNFIANSANTAGCPAAPVSISTPSGTVVALSNVTDVSATQITATVAPPASEPSETATVTVGTAPYTGTGTAQIVASCPTTVFASVLPRTWFAGESYPLTITGTGFITAANATASCPVTPVSLVTQSGVSASLSNITVVSPTQITATVTPDASDPTSIVAVEVGGRNVHPIKTQILGNQIQWTQNGATNTISTTDGSAPPVQNAVVGQQIALTTTTQPAAYGGSLVSTTWTVGGTNIGGYTASTASASVTPTTLNQSSLATYFVYPGSAIPVTYQYCVNIQGANPVLQCSLPANASFTVDGPIGANVIPSDETVGISPDQSEMAWGIRFAASASPPSQAPGAFKWVQLVTSDNVNFYFQDGTSMVCTLGPGLDASYPFAEGITAVDGPSVPLDASLNEIEVTDSTQYQMYLMWDPETSSSIPVPLGYLPWTISGDALYNSETSAWSLNSGTSVTNSSAFVPSNTYPIWSNTLSGTINIQADCK